MRWTWTDEMNKFWVIMSYCAAFRTSWDRSWEERLSHNDELSQRLRKTYEDRVLRFEGFIVGACTMLDVEIPHGHQEIMRRVILDSIRTEEAS